MKFNSKIISISCVTIIIFLIIGKSELYHYYPDYSYGLDSYSIDENKRDSLDSEIRVVKNKLDSIEREKRIYIDGFLGYSGTSGGWLGMVETYQKSEREYDKDTQGYLMLSNIGFKIQDQHGPQYLTFYTKNGLGYISKTKLTTKGKEHNVSYVDKVVNYRYSSEDNTVLLPINSSFWKVLIIIFNYGLFILILALYLFVILSFFKFLIAISKNNIFDEWIINRLKVMAISLLILGSINYFINIIIYILFRLIYKDADVVITYSFWKNDYLMFIFSALCYLIYTVFKKALTLQKEQDLTI